MPRPDPVTIVSNREPYSVRGRKITRNVGGLVAAFEPLFKKNGGAWVAYGAGLKKSKIMVFPSEKAKFSLHRLALKRGEYGAYYYGFSNRVLWPLCHQFSEKCSFIIEYWQGYKKVNRKFANYILRLPGQEVVWIQDFHFSLLPAMIKKRKPSLKLMFFWHIPWPSPSVFSILPWRRQILEGLLGSDLLAFHTQEFVDNFILSVVRILKDAVVNGDSITYKSHTTALKAIPIGIDYKHYRSMAELKQTFNMAEKQRSSFGNNKIILAVDRLDYTKGILRRLWAFEYFLDTHPEWRGKVSLLQIATPSREGVSEYRRLKMDIDRTIGRLEGKFGTPSWQPIFYFYRKYSPKQLAAFYRMSDASLLTPLFDGWNMVASEYVASQVDGKGALILSEFAGASSFFKEAFICNPYDTAQVASYINAALKLPAAKKKRRMEAMRKKIEDHDVFEWMNKNLNALDERP
ncbi:MAG: trehalose-6-phosphate synthase [Elusimicrobia bacterium]|nr:trehalose-6-phosphate synthase [Elusimicrobiota bacterium]